MLYNIIAGVAWTVKNLPAMQETRVWSLGREDPLEKGMAAHSSILAWRIPWTEEPGRLQPTGSQRVGHDWVTLFTLYNIISLVICFIYSIDSIYVFVLFLTKLLRLHLGLWVSCSLYLKWPWKLPIYPEDLYPSCRSLSTVLSSPKASAEVAPWLCFWFDFHRHYFLSR